MNYILQSNNTSHCELITLLNAYWFKHRQSPYPKLSSFNFYHNDFKGLYNIFKKDKSLIYDKLNLERIEYRGTPIGLKLWINHQLKQGNLIDFGGYIREPHSFLIADYNKKLDSYLCINARIFTDAESVEWLPFPLLLKTYKKNIKYNNKSFNNLKVNNLHLTSGVIKFNK